MANRQIWANFKANAFKGQGLGPPQQVSGEQPVARKKVKVGGLLPSLGSNMYLRVKPGMLIPTLKKKKLFRGGLR